MIFDGARVVLDCPVPRADSPFGPPVFAMQLLEDIAARRRYFVLSIVVITLDQATKIAAHAWLRGRVPVTVVPELFDLRYSRNPGGLFGFFSELTNPWRGLLLTVVPLLAVALIAVFLARTPERDRGVLAALALILGGAVGNLIDRVTRGEVVDFLDVYASERLLPGLSRWLLDTFQTVHWPTFNIADSAIVVGVGLLMLDIVRPAPRPAAAPGERPADDGEAA